MSNTNPDQAQRSDDAFVVKITPDVVSKVAKLARIKITAAEQEKFAGELTGIMNWIEQLSEVNTDGVEPMTGVVDMQLYQREDKITDGGYRDKILANAPEAQEGFFVVPKVVE